MNTNDKRPFWQSATKMCLIILVFSVIVLNYLMIDVSDTLKTIVTMVVSFYFGQKSVLNSTSDATNSPDVPIPPRITL